MLGTIITTERSADGLCRTGAADIAILSHLFGRVGPGHDTPDDPHTRNPGGCPSPHVRSWTFICMEALFMC
ncbi:MAG: hypothetical protein JO166_16310 [Deltaproteobacteria bacterium]|nr:hypothetical protein [Deltaproteobacteria bacterium]